MKRRASEPLPAAILHKKAAKVSASQNRQISVVTVSQNMKENVEPVPDVDNFSDQEILDSATDEEALSLFSNIEFDIDDINDDHEMVVKTDSKMVASDQEDSSTSSDSDSQQSNEDNMMTQAVQHQSEVEHEQVRNFCPSFLKMLPI